MKKRKGEVIFKTAPSYQSKRQVFYYPDIAFKEDQGQCRFCLRTVYFDTQHLNSNGKRAPHDWPAENYRDPEKIPHHGDHCPDIKGDQSDKDYYAKLRESKGKPNPWYHARGWDEEEDDEEELDATNPDNKSIVTTGEQVIKNGLIPLSDRQAGLLHKRVTKRKQEIAELKELFKTLAIQVDVLTKSFNDYVYTIANSLSNLNHEANKVIDTLPRRRSFRQGERLDDYVNKVKDPNNE